MKRFRNGLGIGLGIGELELGSCELEGFLDLLTGEGKTILGSVNSLLLLALILK